MLTYLVTGGSGFIGSHLAQNLAAQGERVRILDDLSTGRIENLASFREQVEFVQADIRRLDAIRPYFEGVDYVLHMAAMPSVPRSVADPVTSNAVNVEGTLNVLLAARDAGVKRVVFAASSAAYGDNPQMPRVETLLPAPLSPYALTKVTGEYYCQVFARLYRLETVALRFFNIFGPRQNPYSQYTGVLSKFITCYIRRETAVIFGDGEQSRDFTYVANVVDAVLKACKAPGASGGVFNVGVGESYTLNYTLGVLNRIFGYEMKPRHEEPRAGDVRESLADITMARRVLGYKPKVRFEDGLLRTVEWCRAELGQKAAG
jgi:nucleoside-diphosphate-sugar epimerase